MVGSLDLQRVLRDGEHAFSPGLLARAHGGVLYVDEVNLLHDHLVDVLLDAAAMGRVHVERDGVSHSHDARFMLVGTMNPEEGELRPQLLDRFGLTVDVCASRDVDVRVEVIRRRMDLRGRPRRGSPRVTPTRTRELARRIAAGPCVGRRRGAAGQRAAPHRRAVRGLRRGRDARRSGGGPHRGGARGVATATRNPSSRSRTFASPPNSRCRTGVAAIRSTIPGSTPNSWTRRWPRPANPPPDPNRPRPGSARRRGRAPASAPEQAVPARQFVRRGWRATQRAALRDLPDQGAGGARCRRGCAGPAVAGPQPDRHDGVGHRRSRRRARRAPVRHTAGRRGQAAAARSRLGRGRRRAPRDPRGPRGQSGDLRRRRVRIDGRARPDGGRRRGHAVAAARRLPAPRQGRRHHVPRAAGRRWCCRRRRRCTSRAAGWRASTPAARRRWRRVCSPRATWWCGRRPATARAAAWWWCSPTAAPPADPIRWAAPGAAAGLLVAEGAAAVVVDCETSYVRLGLAEELARQLGAPAVRLAQLRADALTRLVKSEAELGAA